MEFPSFLLDAGVGDENEYDQNEYTEVDWSHALKSLFAPAAAPVKNDCLESDYAYYLDILFAVPVAQVRNICLEYDYGEDLKSLFAAVPLFIGSLVFYAGVGAENEYDQNEYTEVDWSHALKRLFAPAAAPVKNDCLESDYAYSLDILFAVPVAQVRNICLEYDYGEDLKRLFGAAKPYYQIDFEALQAGLAQYAGVPDEDDNYDAEEYGFSDFDFEEAIPFYCVRAKKGAKRVMKLKSGTARKLTRRQGRVRSKKLERKILKGGIYEGLPIMHGSFGPCGFEM